MRKNQLAPQPPCDFPDLHISAVECPRSHLTYHNSRRGRWKRASIFSNPQQWDKGVSGSHIGRSVFLGDTYD